MRNLPPISTWFKKLAMRVSIRNRWCLCLVSYGLWQASSFSAISFSSETDCTTVSWKEFFCKRNSVWIIYVHCLKMNGTTLCQKITMILKTLQPSIITSAKTVFPASLQVHAHISELWLASWLSPLWLTTMVEKYH